MAITVHICDDHALVRSGIRKLIELDPELAVVGESANADDALAQLVALPADVLLLDIVMPGKSGIEALPAIREAAPAAAVLMLSMQDDPAYVRRAFAAGASGYLLKDAADVDLVQAIHEVATGRRYVHSLLGARLAATDDTEQLAGGEDPLSAREREVLRLLALGHTNQEIATLLFISVRTVETHRARIMQKLRLRTRAEIVRYAIAAGELESAAGASPATLAR